MNSPDSASIKEEEIHEDISITQEEHLKATHSSPESEDEVEVELESESDAPEDGDGDWEETSGRRARRRTGEKPFQCKLCDKRFSSPYTLKTHDRVHHSGEQPFQCEECDERFISPYHALKHQQMSHMRGKPFHCKYCNKTFNTKGILKAHERVHTGEKPFRCELCDERFINSYQVLKHLQSVHMRETPFRCQYCHKSFISKGNLKAHERVHTGEERVSKPRQQQQQQTAATATTIQMERGEKPWHAVHPGLLQGKFVFKVLPDGTLDKTRVICTLCNAEMSYCRSTSSLVLVFWFGFTLLSRRKFVLGIRVPLRKKEQTHILYNKDNTTIQSTIDSIGYHLRETKQKQLSLSFGRRVIHSLKTRRN